MLRAFMIVLGISVFADLFREYRASLSRLKKLR
jgi:hypothetical protein